VTAGGESCAAFGFEGAIHVQGARFASGSFTSVSHTEPYGKSDPLASWKLLQFEAFPLSPAEEEKGQLRAVPVNQAVNLSILDPFSKEILLSARWLVKEILVHGRTGSINAGLDTNLSDVRVNNSIESPTLAAFAGQMNGVLVLRFEHTRDVMSALQGEGVLYAPVTGTVHTEECIR
jgi:hypothetical protein